MTISNAALFKQAHAMTRATIQAGDDYRATFGACIKAIKQDNARQADKKLVKQAMATAWPLTAFFAIVCLFMALVVAVSHASSASDHGQAITADNSQAATADDTSQDIMLDNIQAAIDESGVQGVTIVYSE